MNSISQVNQTKIKLEFDSFVDDTFDANNFTIEGVAGQTVPTTAALSGGDPSSDIDLVINNLTALASGDEFIIKYEGLSRSDYPGAPRRIKVTYA